MGAAIEIVRGMRDVLPEALASQQRIAAQIDTTLASYGYRSVELPIIERRDLYLRKLGEELVGKVYEFSFGGRELALRPEWTASVLRAYVDRMQDRPLPLRLRYTGPVFRYERPQRGTYRQFTQMGVELIGGTTPRADAEIIALACAGLHAAGITRYRIRIGHIGFIRALLAALQLTERTQGELAWSLDRIRKEGSASVRERLLTPASGLVGERLPDGVDDAAAEVLLLHALREIGVNLRFGSRPPEAIVGRLVRKLRREDPLPRIERAIVLLEELATIAGAPAQALAAAAAVLDAHDLPETLLSELRGIIALLAAYDLPHEQIVLDFGLGRGLHYYTGMIFEIFAADDLQICGGGRYDDLVTTLGGSRTTPAVGFAYGLERVVDAAGPHADAERVEVLVVATDDAAYAYAVQVAQQLRTRGYAAAIDVRGRSATGALRDAGRREVRFAAIVGPEDAARGTVLWRDLARHEELRTTPAAVPPAGSAQ